MTGLRTLEQILALPEDALLTPEEVLLLPYMRHLKACTLAKWRQLGKGPAYTPIGRKAFYERRDIEKWRHEQKRTHGHQGTIESLALPIQGKGEALRGSTGLGATKRNENAAKAIEAQKRLEVQQGKFSKVRGVSSLVAAREFLTWCTHTEYRQHPNTGKRIAIQPLIIFETCCCRSLKREQVSANLVWCSLDAPKEPGECVPEFPYMCEVVIMRAVQTRVFP